MIIAVVDENMEGCEKTIKCLESHYSGMPQTEEGFIRRYENFDVFLESYFPDSFEAIIIEPGKAEDGGMELLRRIRRQDRNVPIIIYTDYMDYVLEGYTVSAFRYILKSQDMAEKLLLDSMDIILETGTDPRLEIEADGKKQSIFYRDIVFVECIRRAVYIRLIWGKKIKIKNSIKDISRRLCSDGRFVECYRDIVVNLAWIKAVGRQEIILCDGETIPLSRRKKTQIRLQWAGYSGNQKRL